MLELAKPVDALQMKNYMKGHFEFYGVKSPQRKIVVDQLKKIMKNEDVNTFKNLIDDLWKNSFRESQYIALDLLTWRKKSLTFDDLAWVKDLILVKSWWDTVDGLASNIVGNIVMQHSKNGIDAMSAWNQSSNMWLIRTSIIFQLKWKFQTDLPIMFQHILRHKLSKEFFINKASGWALRQASKFYPEEVAQFIKSNDDLSNLTKKEGIKYL